MQRSSLKKIFLKSVIISLLLSAFTGIIVFLVGDLTDLEIKVLFTLLVIVSYSLTGLSAAALYEKKGASFSAISGIIFSVVGLIYFTLLIWGGSGSDVFDLYKSVLTFIIVPVAFAHSSLLLMITTKNVLIKNIVTATNYVIFILALMLLIPIWNELDNVGDFYFRLIGVFAILDVLGTILIPILKKVYAVEKK